MKHRKVRILKSALSGDPCRNLVAAILHRAISDVKRNHGVKEALEFLASPQAADYAAWLNLSGDVLPILVKRLKREHDEFLEKKNVK